MKYDVFISYSRKDTAIADQICAAFDKAGISYFIDRQGIGGGFEFPTVLAENIIDSQIFLFLGSKNSYESKFTNNEVLFAFNKKPHNSILPYLIDDTPLPLNHQFTFASINQRNIKEHPIETTLVDDVLRMLGRTLPKTEPKTSQTAEQTESSIRISENPILTVTTNEPKLKVGKKFYETYSLWKDDVGKYGFVDEQGKVAIPFEYDNAMKFSEGLACVEKKCQWGFIDNSGSVVIPFDYICAYSFSEGLASVAIDANRENADDKDHKKFGFIDKQGNTVIPFEYEEAGSFSEGLAPVALFVNRENADDKDRKKYGFIDKQGNTIIPFEYDEACSFSEGFACVKKNGLYGFIDKRGNIIIPIKYWRANSFSEGLACVMGSHGYGFLNKKGRVIIPFEYRQAESFSEGLACVQKNSFYGFIDKNGRIVIPFEYLEAHSFSEGLACVGKKTEDFHFPIKWGFIDKKGDLVIPIKYIRADSFENGIAEVTEVTKTKKGIFNRIAREQTFFIDKNGSIINILDLD